MSTTSTIYVKVRKEDKGKTLKCDLSKVILNLDNAFKIKKEEIERKITPITLDKDYIRIYVHRNGDVDGVGYELLTNYDYKKILNLILLGDESDIVDVCTPYVGRTDFTEEWEDVQPMTMYDVEQDEMFTYLLDDDDGRQYVCFTNKADINPRFAVAAEVLAELGLEVPDEILAKL